MAEAIQYKCPHCGGEVEYNPNGKNFKCPYCAGSFSENEVKDIFKQNEQTDLSRNRQETNDFTEQSAAYSCPSCGAEIISEETASAMHCYYCHNPVILTGRLSGDYKPDKIIPFKINKENALIILEKWVKKRWFIPKDFKQSLTEISGVYVPFWLADCDTEAEMNAIGKKIRSWTSGKYQYTETKEYNVYRRGFISFIDFPADGSKKIDDALMDAMEPFHYADFKPFSMSYLSGFVANKYDVSRNEVLPRIKTRIETAANAYLNATIHGYTTVSKTSFNAVYKKTDWEYALLPVWFLHYKYNEKNYDIAINGQTGKLAGTPPIDYKKLLLFCGGLSLLVSAICIISKLFS